MTLYGEQAIEKFTRKYGDARKPLARFLAIARAANWKHLVDLKETFRAADYAPETGLVIFNISGNKYRLTAYIDFEEQILSIENIMTHEQYSREKL